MKKFLGLILLSFFWCNIVIAECQKGDCVNGEGTLSFSDDMKYIGEFQLGQFHGQGTLLSYGDKYVGEFKEGNYHGDGILTYSNGDKYVGEFQLGQFHGQGTFTDSNGNVKEGRWTHNVLEIKKAKTKNYESTNVVAENEKNTIKVDEKKKTSLCQKGDCVNGEGTYTYENGNKYVGEWKDGLMHGQGTHTWAKGSKYVGEYKDGKRHGQGTYFYADGDEYVGEWKDGQKHGQGTFTSLGDVYVGEWKDGLMHGQGTLTWADGEKYVGGYKDGYRHGQGTHTLIDGSVRIGTWSYDNFQGGYDDTKNNSASSKPKQNICSVNRSLFCSAQRVLDICGTYVNESAYNSCMYRFEEIGNTLERSYGLTNNEFVMGVTSCKC